jgi:hypothetical protein
MDDGASAGPFIFTYALTDATAQAARGPLDRGARKPGFNALDRAGLEPDLVDELDEGHIRV